MYFPERVHNPNSQRLDARAVAGLYGLTLVQFCKLIEKDYDSTRKTPDRAAIQDVLAQLFRIWDSVFEVLNEDEEAVRRWFNRPNRGLDRARPIELIGPNRIDELEEAAKRMRSGDYS